MKPSRFASDLVASLTVNSVAANDNQASVLSPENNTNEVRVIHPTSIMKLEENSHKNRSTVSSTFQYGEADISEFRCVSKRGKRGKHEIAYFEVGDEKIVPTKRWLKSFQMCFRVAGNVLNYYTPLELFNRIAEVKKGNATVRYCVETPSHGPKKMLAFTNPKNAHIKFADIEDICLTYGTENFNYTGNGTIISQHCPKVETNVKIAGDAFSSRFHIEVPIDGFGKPNVYLSMLRQVCTNGMVAYAPSFRQEISVGKKHDGIHFSIQRALDTFNNEDGYNCIIERITEAAKSYASVREVLKLEETLTKAYGNKQTTLKGLAMGDRQETNVVPCVNELMKVCSDTNTLYGVSNLRSLSDKKQRTLPTRITMYDLINFASEIGTHWATEDGKPKFNAYIGSMLQEEYDLEGSAEKYSDYKDFFIHDEKTAQTMADMQSLSA